MSQQNDTVYKIKQTFFILPFRNQIAILNRYRLNHIDDIDHINSIEQLIEILKGINNET